MSNDIENKEKQHIKKVYKDKSLKYLGICTGIFIFSFATYFYAILCDVFDFGLIFEIISFIFVLIARSCIKHERLNSGKRNLVVAMIPIGWLIIYEFIDFLVNFYYMDITLILIIILLYSAYTSINKIETKYKEQSYEEEFYDKL